MKMERQAKIGSIIRGSMLEEDLIPTLMAELEDLDPKAARKLREQEVRWEVLSFEDEYRARCYWLMDKLFYALNECAPPLCYFGEHPKDSSDFGFWFSEDTILDAIYDEEILVTEDYKSEIQFTDVKFPLNGYEYCLHVNDHGNITLYDKDGNEVWSIV